MEQQQKTNAPIIENISDRIKALDSMKLYEQEVDQFRYKIFCEHLHYDEWQNGEIPEVLAKYAIELYQKGHVESQLEKNYERLLPKFKELGHPRLRKLFDLIQVRIEQQRSPNNNR